MKEELKAFNKITPITHIKTFLENKYKKRLSYSMVFYEFKKLYPNFGADDVNIFIKSLKYKRFYFKYEANKDGSLNKIIFLNNDMKKNYKYYGNDKILILDSTYKKNTYDFPLCNLIGLDHNGHNILFAQAFIVDETIETFEIMLSYLYILELVSILNISLTF